MRSQRLSIAILIVFAAMISTPAIAGYDIGGASSNIFTKITKFMQDIVNFLDGPAAIAIVVISLVGAIVLWNMAPGRSEWIGRTFRAVASAIFLLDIGVLVTYLRG